MSIALNAKVDLLEKRVAELESQIASILAASQQKVPKNAALHDATQRKHKDAA